MPRWLQFTLGLLIAFMLLAVPFGYASYRHKELRSFRVVKDGVLYRSGQLTLPGLKRVVYDYNIKTVITLRDGHTAGEPAPDTKEEEYCQAQEINYFRLPLRKWSERVGPDAIDLNVKQFLEVMANPENYPVLVHCFAGVHRTGAYCAIYRMEHEHQSNDPFVQQFHKRLLRTEKALHPASATLYAARRAFSRNPGNMGAPADDSRGQAIGRMPMPTGDPMPR